MAGMSVPAVAVMPEGLRPHIAEAVEAGGGRLAGPDEAQMLVWTDPSDVDGLVEVLGRCPDIAIVQLIWAGVESFHARGLFDDGRTWLNGKGIYADPVAEHALALGLAGLRGLPGRVGARSWGPQWGRSLVGGRVTILGGGGITESLVRLLRPFEATTTVVRRSTAPMEGVARVLGPDRTAESVRDADLVVLALALTPETVGIVDAHLLGEMPSHAWLVNVARGGHVVTDDLVEALKSGVIGGAGLDVTDPEPLPEGHPLWALDNAIITPHTANTEAMAVPLVSARVRANVARLAAGDPLIGQVDPALGY